jgi:hypothetical protein
VITVEKAIELIKEFWDKDYTIAVSKRIFALYKKRSEILVIVGIPNDKDGLKEEYFEVLRVAEEERRSKLTQEQKDEEDKKKEEDEKNAEEERVKGLTTDEKKKEEEKKEKDIKDKKEAEEKYNKLS